ncbi:peptidoglycan DD-metalloendopeptidase family protein [Reichenbachiella ulvae]|uniref:Peptidoglycan DD-metalloendopeptidase family protein n=1 Tax=Reichenbachiella ulvae TaxID=2980104 RepID=A0ABT3CVY4_9BACT|nr:peptidoglycan DD-metalloendopeptidase family protein [Reichenbachiella ulvae]MCV9387764.1 peptidoglycan DD-metalloendopeptidase family protein [Reichenbachiella ulvae]
MKYFFLSLLLGMSNTMIAQNESSNYSKAALQFQQFYNATEYDSIFELYDDGMRGELSRDKSQAFLSSLYAQVGAIQTMEFSRFEEQVVAVYKTTFERATLAINMVVSPSGQITGLRVLPFVEAATMERNMSKMILPFKEEWTVVWGGDTKEQNYHVQSLAQKGAFDIVITDEMGKSYKEGTGKNEDYYAFGKELYAPCAAEVVMVVDGIYDNEPGKMNPAFVTGNTVVLRTENEEYLYFAHFKQNSIVVEQGQQVQAGDLLGLCGNSGNSSEAHIHFHIQDGLDMNASQGVKCYFDQLLVNGESRKDYSPVQGDKIKP